jgi:5-methylcytosine-specific restriction endonuclease McrA
MKPLSNKYKKFLSELAPKLQKSLQAAIPDYRVRFPSYVDVTTTSTLGWAVTVATFKNIPGRLELWLDLFPNIGRPIIAVCYSNGDTERVRKIISISLNRTITQPDLRRSDIYNDVLEKQLAKKYFNKFIFEGYGSTNYMTNFFSDSIGNRKKLSSISFKKLLRISKNIIRTIVSVLESEDVGMTFNYPAIENRTTVVNHLKRERSSRLAQAAKKRDGYVCQICKFSLVDYYGDLARGFAEVHHKIPLASLRNKTVTQLKDLITVCPNCHRMLHRMTGQAPDIRELKKIYLRYNNRDYSSN